MMHKHWISKAALTALALLAVGGCNRDWAAAGAGGRAMHARADATGGRGALDAGSAGMAAPGQASMPGGTSSMPGAPAGFADLPDRGDLVGYPHERLVRRSGAYTWHRADISEAHALRAIFAGVLNITTPSGERLKFQYERHVEHASGDWTWVGKILDAPAGQEAIITFGAKAVFGSIDQPGAAPLRLTARDGVAWLIETDQSLLAKVENSATRPRGPDFLIPPATQSGLPGVAGDGSLSTSTSAVGTASATTAATTTVDVVIGYTPGFTTAQGSASAAVTRVNYLVEVANQAYVNSQVDARIRLVHAMQVSYTDLNSNETALEALTGNDGEGGSVTIPAALQLLRNARETYGADLVSLVRDFQEPEHDGCGIAWLLGGGLSSIHAGHEPFGYSVVSDGTEPAGDGKTYYCRDETLAHELGHNMGSAHDLETAKGDDGVLDGDEYGRFTYSFGYKTGPGAGDFYTIMAYGDVRESAPFQTAYRVFSNPRIVSCGTFRCGTSSADNARSLGQTMPIIAGFRATVVPGGIAVVHNDVNADLRSDLLWFKQGLVDIWYMNGYHIQSTHAYTPASNLYPYVTGAFNNADGADIAWRDNAGLLIFWLGGPTYSRGNRDYPMSLGWRLQASGDRNGDGVADLYWRSSVDGRLMYWLLGPNQELLEYRAFAQAPAFDMVTSGDFNGDGATDLFFRRRSDGQTVLWLASGTGFAAVSPGAMSKYWVPVNSSDYEGDGDDDIVWRSTIDGRVLIWLMQNGQRVAYKVFDSDMTRELLGSADFNADNRLDLVWRRNDGAVSVWLNTGTGFNNRYAATKDLSWQLVKGGR